MNRIANLIVLAVSCGCLAQAAAAGRPDYSVNPNPVLFLKKAHPLRRRHDDVG
jgi:hypothetical protein